MLNVARFFMIGIAVLLVGCVPRYYTEPERAALLMKDARSAFMNGEPDKAVRSVDFAVARPAGAAEARDFFQMHPDAAPAYAYYVEQEIAKLKGPQSAQERRETLQALRSGEVLPVASTDWLNRFFDAEMVSASKSGSLPITLFDEISDLPALQFPAPRRIILDRTVARLARDPNTADRPVGRLVAYYQLDDASPEEKAIIRRTLSTLQLRRSELSVVGEVFADVAAARRSQLTTTATLNLVGADRLFKDDLMQAMGVEPGIEWMAGGATVITVEKLRHNETVQPERTQTIIYASHQVDVLKAALLMPKNASYLYEFISSGSSVEYGYVITATSGSKQIYEEIVRGTLGSEGGRCQNPRVQNVFGGVNPASFMANDDMVARCSSAAADDVGALRAKVNKLVVAAVMRVPPLKAIVDQR